MKILLGMARAFLSAVFLLSGGLKLLDPGQFLLDVQSFNAVPYGVAYFVAMFLPVLEILCALALWYRRLAFGAGLLLIALLIGFIGLMVTAELRGLNLHCGCFGDWLIFPDAYMHIGFNCILLGLLLLDLIYRPEKARS